MPRSAARQFDLFPNGRPADPDVWVDRLLQAFDDFTLETGFLALAEEAIAACPGNLTILMLAATAALLDGNPQRALIYLKRFAKRASAPPEERLLTALALAQLGRRPAARSMLERGGMIQ